MVARSPPKLQLKKKTMAAPPPPLDPTLLREIINKVDKAIARLQELQFTVTGGEMVVSGVTLSPRSTRGYLRTSLKCKQETLRMKNSSARRSPTGNLPKNTGDWKRMSLPAMLLGETVGEILQASQFARQIVEAANDDDPKDDPKTPLIQKKQKNPDNLELPARRKREKQAALQTIRSDLNPLSLQRAKSRINFKVSSSSPLHKSDCCEKENCRYIANRVSPRNKPWVKKTVLFPNPLFHSSTSPNSTSKNQSLCRNKSPQVVRQTPHKFLIKSPPKMRSPQFTNSPVLRRKKSPIKESGAAKFRRSFSPSRLANKLVSPLKSGKCVQENDGSKMIKRSFSPSRLVNKLASPLKSKKCVQENDGSKMIKRSFSPSRLVNKLASPLKSKKCVQENDGIKMMKIMMATTGHKQRLTTSSPPKVSSSVIRKSFSPTKSTILMKKSSPPSKVSSSSATRKSFSPTNSTILRKRSSPPSKVFSAAIRKSLSPTNSTILRKRLSPPPKESTAAKFRRSFSPSRLATKLASPLKSRKSVSKNDGFKMMMMMTTKQKTSPPKVSSVIRRSFSPLKGKQSASDNDDGMRFSGLKQRPIARGTPIRA